jgi:hypothetical protein
MHLNSGITYVSDVKRYHICVRCDFFSLVKASLLASYIAPFAKKAGAFS